MPSRSTSEEKCAGVFDAKTAHVCGADMTNTPHVCGADTDSALDEANLLNRHNHHGDPSALHTLEAHLRT